VRRACGERVQCINCSLTLTYHKRDRRLLCHYCGYAEKVPGACPKCRSEHIYFLGIGNVLYGVDADIGRTDANRLEHLRRLGEVANILLDAGLIVIATAVALTQEDIEVIRTSGGSDRVITVWLGDPITTDLSCDLTLTEAEAETDGTARLKTLLHDCGAMFRPW